MRPRRSRCWSRGSFRCRRHEFADVLPVDLGEQSLAGREVAVEGPCPTRPAGIQAEIAFIL